MSNEEFAQRVESIRDKLYKTAMLYMGSHSQVEDVLGETIYKALCGHKRLRSEEYFDTWITRILINECYNELRKSKKLYPIEAVEETATVQEFDSLPLKEAVRHLPKNLRDVIILRFFSGFTQAETAAMLKIPQGTVVTRQRKALQLLRLELEEEVAYES